MATLALQTGLILLVVFVVLLLLGVPIAVTIALSSVAGILAALSPETSVFTASQRIFTGVNIFSLLAIPFFVLAGNIMNSGGIAIRLVNIAKFIAGRLPGSLAHTNVVGNTLFVGCRIGKTKIENVIKHLLPFYVAIIVVLMLVTFIPEISLFIPKLCGLVK